MSDVDEASSDRRINEDEARHCDESGDDGGGVARRPTTQQLLVTA
jgi:hypothetical protein